MAEKDTRREFIKLAAELDPHPVENLLPSEVGMPDVNFAGGWAELKWLPKWPVRTTTPVRIDHYTDAQRNWLWNRTSKTGEQCWLVLQVGKEWLFFDAQAAQEVGTLTYEELVDHATRYFPNKPTPEEVVSILTSG